MVRSTRRARLRRHTLTILTLAISLVFAPMAHAGNATGINVQLPTGYSISGKVVNSAGNGVRGVTVLASGPNGRSTATGSGGSFTIRGLSPGEYRIAFEADYDQDLQDGFYTSSNASRFTAAAGSATKVKVGPNRSLGTIKIPRGFSIAGKVTTPGGAPLSGVSVNVSGGDYGWAMTNSNGNYKVVGLSKGAYVVSFDADGNRLSGYYASGKPNKLAKLRGDATKLNLGPSRTGINVSLPTGGTISGTVLDATGTPFVWGASASAGGEWASADAAGAYELTGLWPGNYKVRIDPPWGQGWQSGYYRNDADGFTHLGSDATAVATGTTGLETRTPMGLTISGKVTKSGGTAVAGAFVTASGGGMGGFAVTVSNGTYKITGLTPGSYVLSFMAPDGVNLRSGYYRSGATGSFTDFYKDASKVSVGPNRTGIDVRLPAGYKISGKITGAGAGALKNASVSVSGSTGGFGYATTNSSGEYQIVGLRKGTYKVHVSSPEGSRFRDGWYTRSNASHYTGSAGSASGVTIGP